MTRLIEAAQMIGGPGRALAPPLPPGATLREAAWQALPPGVLALMP